uniref:PD-(D/E)XK nuclease family protein n=1 Tax=Nitrospira cf. moscoviensis SBR1015 TaxID=96242 RepID=UPI001120B402|nr:PD-(D/E)XK nuclease family protein [Nitrospira cf. moscoviensis SBR1015]
MDAALRQMKDVWDRTAAKPLVVRDLDVYRPIPGEELRCWASGTRVTFDAATHTYSGDGKQWLSGSVFADRYKGGFNTPVVAQKVADKYGVEASEVIAMWELNRDASATVGTAVHAALQLRGQYAQLSRSIKDGSLESALTKNPILLPLVEAFFATREHEDARYEVFVADPVRAHCGFIDRLVIEPDGLYVEDYKTNADLAKSETISAPFKGVVPSTQLGSYWLQLSFYARILRAHGKTVKGLRIHHWRNNQWETHEHEMVDIEGLIKGSNAVPLDPVR